MKTGGRPMLGEGACARILQIISLCKTQARDNILQAFNKQHSKNNKNHVQQFTEVPSLALAHAQTEFLPIAAGN
jgi:hypothetical protein